MAQQSIDLNSDRGAFLFDSISRSVWNNPSAYCDDLDGCGILTHLRTQHSFNLSARINCDPASPALQWSFSGLVDLLSTDQSQGAFTATVNNVALSVTIGKVQAFMNAMYVAAPLTPAEVIAGLNTMYTLTGGATFLNRGNRFILQSPGSSRRTVAEASYPQVYRQVDSCGVEVGSVVTFSTSILGFDNATCKSRILWQLTPRIFFADNVYGVDNGDGTFSQPADMVIANTDASYYGSAFVPNGYVVAANVCNNIPADPGGRRAFLLSAGPEFIGVV